METQKGTVKFFDEEKRFGFISVDETGKDVFVHKSGINGSIRENDRVEFTIESGDKGLFASNVKVL